MKVFPRKAPVRRLLLIVLPYVALSLSACDSLTANPPRSGDEKAQENSTGAAPFGTVDGGRSQADKFDVCSLTTREEVEAALGRTVMEPTRADELVSRKAGTVTSSCMFGSNNGFVRLAVRRPDPESATNWSAARAYEDLQGLIKGGDGQSTGRSEEVKGLGTAAFAETKAETTNHETTELRVLNEGAILTVRVTGPATTPTLEAAKIIAGKATARLASYESNAAPIASDDLSTLSDKADRPDGDERRKAAEGAQTKRKSAKDVDQGIAKVSPAKAGKDKSQRDDSPKQSKKPAKESAKKSAGKSKQTAKANPKRRS